MPSYFTFGLFPPIGDFRFTPVDAEVSPNLKVGNMPGFDEKPYNNSTQDWQTAKPYYTKKTFNDLCTVYVQTARAGTSDPIYPALELVDACETMAVSLTPYVNGAQRISGNAFTLPGTATSVPLDTFSWKFTMGLAGLDVATQSGVYKLRMTIYGDNASTIFKIYESDLFIIYDSFPNTALIQGAYPINNSEEGVITGGWADGQLLQFTSRVECSLVKFNLQGVKVGYYQQSYLELMQQDKSWRTWEFVLGGAAGSGVPDFVFEKVDKLFGTSSFTINAKSYSLFENSDSPKFAWNKTDPEASGLIWATIPVRERYLGENVLLFQTPTPDLTIFTPEGYPFAIPRWRLNNGFSIDVNPPAIIDDISEYNAYVTLLNSFAPLGTYFLTGTTLKYTPAPGYSPSIFGVLDLLYIEFNPLYKASLSGGTNGLRVAGFGISTVIDWGDGSAVEYYTYPDFMPHDIPHTFLASATDYPARIFHNDILTQLVFNESGTLYPIANVLLKELTGDLPTLLVGFDIAACNGYAAAAAGVTMVDITPCLNLQSLSFRNNPQLTTFGVPLFGVGVTRDFLAALQFKNCPFDSTTTDLLFNDYVANSWDGVLASGLFVIENSPAAAPTAASLTARNDLIAESWTIAVDP